VGTAARAKADVCFVDPRDDIRIIVNVPGRYSLASKLDLRGARREFACRVINMSTRRMGLVAPVSGPLASSATSRASAGSTGTSPGISSRAS
jgi:hypothetical protein